jgi:A/G-specific adenine glycosylase
MKSTRLTAAQIRAFRRGIYQWYGKHKRYFPWRETHNPYRILLSEIMLQQTQAGPRTVQKYELFVSTYPQIEDLAQAKLSDVLALWQGLGYNRRARALRDAARMITEQYHGRVPRTVEMLTKLPGVGAYTASAVAAFAYNEPAILIETNIRTVFLHTFFARTRRSVDDRELVPFIAQTLDRDNPRVWYSALMDYGAHLKRLHPDINKKSRHYVRQSAFKGSDREIRGAIVRTLAKGTSSTRELSEKTAFAYPRVKLQLKRLCAEGMVAQRGRRFEIVA